jgi:glycogen synthase
MWALDQGLAALRDKKGRDRLLKNGMAKDFSWDRSAREYVDLYRRAMSRV